MVVLIYHNETVSSRMHAKFLPAPTIRTLRNAQVTFQTNRVSSDNTLTFTFHLVTPLTEADDGIVIEGIGSNQDFDFKCYTEVYDFPEFNTRLSK